MGFIIAVIMGGIIGWIASKIMNTNAQQGIFMDIIIGCLGSLLGKFVYGLFTGGNAGLGLRDGIDIPSLAVALAGALILLAIKNMVTRGRLR